MKNIELNINIVIFTIFCTVDLSVSSQIFLSVQYVMGKDKIVKQTTSDEKTMNWGWSFDKIIGENVKYSIDERVVL